jgi:hypothetical protein
MSETLYGFGKADADYLVSTIPGAGTREPPTKTGFAFHMLLAKTGGSGIAANSSANVTLRVPTSTGWTDSSITYLAYNQHPTAAVASSTIVVIAPINGRWVVVTELCA